MNVVDQIQKVFAGGYGFAFEFVLEQAAASLIPLVYGFSVTVKEVGEYLTGIFGAPCVRDLKGFQNLRGLILCGFRDPKGFRNFWGLSLLLPPFQPLPLLRNPFHPHQKMKMIPKQTIGVGIRNGENILLIFPQKIAVILRLVENILLIIPTIKDMVKGIEL
jgi:hypothetical protein